MSNSTANNEMDGTPIEEEDDKPVSGKTQWVSPYIQSLDLEAAIGKKITKKQEHFAMLLSRAGIDNMTDYMCYKIAYGRDNDTMETLRVNASKTKAIPAVTEAVKYFKDFFSKKAVKSFEYGVEEAFRDYEEAHAIAREKRDAKTMVLCTSKKAELNGLIIKRTENITPERSIDALDQEILQFLKSLPKDIVKRVAEDVTDIEVIEAKKIGNK